MSATDTVRTGILGAGFMGSAHAECYDLLGVPISMIASRSETKVASRRPGTRWSSDIEAVINDSRLSADMRERGRRRAAPFTWSASAAQLHSVYAGLL